MKPSSATDQRSPVQQVDDILAQNARILAMNEKLLQAILKHGHGPVVNTTINLDELKRRFA